MKQKIAEQVRKFHMIQPADEIYVALSGGADSVALLLALQELAAELDFTLKAIHVEHGIRGASSVADAEFVQKLCRSRKIPLELVTVDVPTFASQKGLGIEEAARILRYEAFEQVLGQNPGGTKKIALAHHANDQAETMLFQMARGSGLKGMCGMEPVRKDRSGNLYIRPMLLIEKVEILAYLKENEQDYCIDATNEDEAYSRNFIRGSVLPALEQVNTCAVTHFAEEAVALQEVWNYVQGQAEASYAEIATETFDEGGEIEEVALCTAKLSLLPNVLVGHVIRIAIHKICDSLKDVTTLHIQAVRDLIGKDTGKRVDLPYGVSAAKTKDAIVLFAKKAQKDFVYSLKIVDRITLGDTFLQEKAYTIYLDYDKIKDGFVIREHEDGDWFFLERMQGRKNVNRELIDRKVPAFKRGEIRVLAGEEHIYAVLPCRALQMVGRVSADAFVNDETNTVLIISECEREN